MRLSISGEGHNLALDFLPLLIAGQPQIIVGLQPHPHLRARAEEPRQPQRSACCDAALLQNNFIDAPGRHVQRLRQRILRQPRGDMNSSRKISPGCTGARLVIFIASMNVHDFHVPVPHLAIPPAEANPEWSR